ncbi:MAG: lipoate--protein ligase [Spirochaetaceae bacterium]|nr:MAG: lipoate--protein ligase [Spirochaetaceae bacterium]
MRCRATIAVGMHSIDLHSAAPPGLLRVVCSATLDPYRNLALEQQLYDELQPDQLVLFLWRNAPVVVIGRHQNPWIECDLDAMRAAGVWLARRASGGGAVYHDPGNGNFSFLAAAEHYDQRLQFAIVMAALADIGISAEQTGRNDILADGRKFSGSAFRYRSQKSYHHGTLLIDADLDRLSACLNPVSTAVTESKAIASVRSRVVNLGELVPGLQWAAVCERLVAAAERAYGVRATIESIDAGALRGDDVHTSLVAELRSWQWIYGRTPDFRRLHRVEGGDGAAELELHVHRGRISGARIVGAGAAAGVSPDMQRLIAALTGIRYRPEDLRCCAAAMSATAATAGVCAQLARQLGATAGIPLEQEGNG